MYFIPTKGTQQSEREDHGSKKLNSFSAKEGYLERQMICSMLKAAGASLMIHIWHKRVLISDQFSA
jgi:hypothetical protein